MPPQIDLYRTPSATRILFVVVAGFIGLVGLAFAGVGIAVGVFTETAVAGGIAFFLCPAAIGGLVAFAALFMILKVVRGKAWLEGSRAFMRGAFTTKSADLRTAHISVGTSMHRTNTGSSHSHHTYPVQSVIAQDQASGQRVTLPIRRAGATVMSAGALTAIADAITAGRSAAGPDDQALVIAQRLRDFARDPFA